MNGSAMRLFIWLCISLLLTSPALAYIEEDTAGMAEATAGEQNTNMYRLNARGEYCVKRLKKIDEYAPKGGRTPDITSIEDISNYEQKNKEEEQNKRILADISKLAANPRQLKENVKPELYTSLALVNGVRDTEIVAYLSRQLKGGRR